MISRKPRDVRLPSLSQVAGPDILSLDLKAASHRYSPMQYYNTTPIPGSRHRSSNPGFGSSNVNPSSSRLRSSFEGDCYNDPFALPPQFQGGMPPLPPLSPLPPLEPLGNTAPRRARKYSSSNTLRVDFGSNSKMSMSTSLAPPPRALSGSRGQFTPLPPLQSFGSSSDLPPLPSYGLPHSHRPSRSAALDTDFTGSTLLGSQRPFPYSPSMGLDSEQDWNGLSSTLGGMSSLSTLPGETSRAGHLRGSGMSSTSGLKRRASTMNLNVGTDYRGASTGFGGLPTPTSPYPSTSSGLGLGGGGLGMLPMPPVQRTTSRSVTGHIVLATDYRLVRLSQNISGWLGFSTTAAIGQPVSSLVAATDQLIFSDFLANLHAERRKAEKSRLHSGLDGGEGSARGVSVTVNLTSGYGGSKPFVLTIWPVTRRMQGYQQAVLTGELIPAFADAFSPIQSVTPL